MIQIKLRIRKLKIKSCTGYLSDSQLCPKTVTLLSGAKDLWDSLGTGPMLEHYFNFLGYEPVLKETSVKEIIEKRKSLLHAEWWKKSKTSVLVVSRIINRKPVSTVLSMSTLLFIQQLIIGNDNCTSGKNMNIKSGEQWTLISYDFHLKFWLVEIESFSDGIICHLKNSTKV